MKDNVERRLMAEQRASEVYRAIETIDRQRDHIRQLMRNHDASVGDNAQRRDCERFHEWLQWMLLADRAEDEARRVKSKSRP